MQYFLTGLLLGWGAAIPIGPVNIEIMRRNLTIRPLAGLFLGFGACSADVTYVVLLGLGALPFLQYDNVLSMLGIVSGLILLWFAWQAFQAQAQCSKMSSQPDRRGLFTHGREGYVMTLFNPYTVLFWASISAQLALLSANNGILLTMVAGVFAGTVSWVIGFNSFLSFTRHLVGANAMRWLNRFGGMVLFGFSLYSLWYGAQRLIDV